MLGAWNSRQRRILGAGADEYKRVAAASLWLFGIIAIVSYVLHIDTARGYVGVALPIGLVGLLLGRWLLRQHLSVDRHHGRSMSRLMLIGGPSAVAHLAASLHREKHAGYLPVAAYAPGERGELGVETESGLPILGAASDTPSILDAIDRCNADAVAISAGVQLHPQILASPRVGTGSREHGLDHGSGADRHSWPQDPYTASGRPSANPCDHSDIGGRPARSQTAVRHRRLGHADCSGVSRNGGRGLHR